MKHKKFVRLTFLCIAAKQITNIISSDFVMFVFDQFGHDCVTSWDTNENGSMGHKRKRVQLKISQQSKCSMSF